MSVREGRVSMNDMTAALVRSMERLPDFLRPQAAPGTWEWVNALGRRKRVKAYFIQGREVFEHPPVERCKATYRMPLHKIVFARWLADIDDVDGLVNGVEAILSLPDQEWRVMPEHAYETVAASSWHSSSRLFEAALIKAFRRAGKEEGWAGEIDRVATPHEIRPEVLDEIPIKQVRI